MTVTVIVVGPARGPLGAAVEDYEERAGRYWNLEVVEVEAGARGGRRDDVVAAEGQRILARLPDRARAAALTRRGKGMTSRGLARWLQKQAVDARDVVFVVGGAYGLGPEVLRRVTRHLTLSPMTLPHELARLVLAEQLYRAGTIVRGEPYHKGS